MQNTCVEPVIFIELDPLVIVGIQITRVRAQFHTLFLIRLKDNSSSVIEHNNAAQGLWVFGHYKFDLPRRIWRPDIQDRLEHDGT